MTDVGRITVGVDIDGGDLGAQIGAEVRAQLAPILAEIQREINATNKDLASLDTSGLRNVTKESGTTQKATDGLTRSTDTLTKAEQQAAQQARRLADERTGETLRTQAAAKAHDDYAKTLQQSTKAATNAFSSQLNEIQKLNQRSPQQLELDTKKATAKAQAWQKDFEAKHVKKQVDLELKREEMDRRFTQWQAELNARALKVPVEPESKGGGGGGRGGGGRGGSGGGGFDSAAALGAVLPFGNIGTAIFAGLGELPAAATVSAAAIASVSGALVQLSGAAVAVPGVIAGVGASGGVAALGIIPLVGALKDAIKASDGTPASMKKAAQALSGLSQDGKDLVGTILGLKPAFDDLQKLDETNLFTGISGKVQTLADTLLPHLKTGIGEISTALNQDLGQALDSLGSGQTGSLLDRIFGNTAVADTKIKAAIDPAITAIGHLVAAGSDALPRIADEVAKVVTEASDFITKADQSGALDRFINNGITGVNQLFGSFGNVFKILGDINNALNPAGGTGGFLKGLDDGTKKLADFLASARGQDDLKKFFAEGAKDLKDIGEAAKQLPGVFAGIVTVAHDIDTTLVPVLTNILKILNDIPGGVPAILTAFLAFKVGKGAGGLLGGLLGDLDTAKGGIDALPGAAEASAGGIRNAFSKAGIAALIATAAGGIGNSLLNPKNPDGTPGSPSVLSSLGGLGTDVGGGILAGGQLGGPVGAAAGAMIGAAVAMFQAATNQLDKAKTAFEQRRDQDAANPDRPGSPDTARQVTGQAALFNPSLNTPAVGPALASLIASGRGPAGFTLGPDGSIIGPDGQPLNLGPQFGTLPTTVPPPVPPAAPQFQIGPAATQVVQQAVPPPPRQLVGAAAASIPQVQTPASTSVFGPAVSGIDAAQTKVDALKTSITTLPTGEINIKDPTPDIVKNVTDLGGKVVDLKDHPGVIQITAPTAKVSADIDALIRSYQNRVITLQLQASAPGLPAPGVPGHALGGAIGRYALGGSVPILAMPGEHRLAPDEVLKMGGQAGVYRFRSMLNSGLLRGFDGGGGVDPNLRNIDPELWQTLIDQQIIDPKTLQYLGDHFGHPDQGAPARQDDQGSYFDDQGKPYRPVGGPVQISPTSGPPTQEISGSDQQDWHIPYGYGRSQVNMQGSNNDRGLGNYQTFESTPPGTSGEYNLPFGGSGGIYPPIGTKGARIDKAAFAGLTPEEIAALLGMHPLTAALGGAITGNIRGADSVLLGVQPGEHIFDTEDVRLMGGQSGVYKFRQLLNAGLIRGFDIGGDPTSGPGGGPPIIGGDLAAALAPLIAAVNEVRDAVLATNPNATTAAQTAAVASGKINTSGIPAVAGLPTTSTRAALTPQQQAQNTGLTAALKPLTTTINDAIKRGQLTDPSAPVDQELLATRNAALARNQGLITASGPAGSVQQADFIQKSILDPLAAALNATVKKNAPSANLPKVGVASDDPVVLAILSLREALVGGAVPATTKGGKQSANITNGVPIDPNTGLPIPGAVAPGTLPPGTVALPGGQLQQATVDQNGVPLTDIGTRLLNGAIQGLGGSVSTFGKTGISALNQSTNFPLPPSVQQAPSATVQQLINQNNPEALAAALGYNVPNLAVQGGTPQSGLTKNTGPAFDASGQLYSDTSALTNRTYTDAVATQNAEIHQLQDVMNQVKDQLTSQVLEPIMEEAVTKGISAMSAEAQAKIGIGLGTGAAPPIASAVGDAVANAQVSGGSNTSSDTGATAGVTSGISSVLGSVTGGVFDEGGIMPTHTIGLNLSGAPERVLSPTQTQMFDSGLLGGWNLQPMAQHMAGEAVGEGQAGGANATVGADFFGASQIPILGAIINFLIQTLLSVIGVTITATSTLDNMSQEVRKFRGDFQKFDATGRLTNDNSGLLDRSNSSEQEVEAQRLRILQQVIQGIVKFIIDDIIGPVVKAVGDAAVNAGGAAAGGALDSVAPGAGGIVSSLISSAGDAGVGIGVSIGTNAGESAASALLSALFGIVSNNSSPGITSILGGNLLGGLLGGSGSGSITSIFSGLLGSVLDFGGLLGGGTSGTGLGGGLLSSLLGGISGTGGSGGLLGGLLGGSGASSILNLFTGGLLTAFTSLFSGVGGAFGLSGLLNGLTSFDDGGIASGIGMMPKSTIKPERVLSPAQTQSFDRLVDALGSHGGSTSTVSVHAPINLQGTSATPEAVRDRLLALMS